MRKVALVHDWLTGMRGGEKVLEAAIDLFPEADLFTLIHDPKRVSEKINSRRIHVSWLNALPGVTRYYRYLLPLMPGAIERFDLGDYDLVLSFNHCVAKGIQLSRREGHPPSIHICYCHTPMRYVYEQFRDYFADKSRPWLRIVAGLMRPILKRWDKSSSRFVDVFVANSENVRKRIQKAYGRDARVIYPCVDTEFYQPSVRPRTGKPYYLAAGALVPYKRFDLAIAACREVGASLKIVGVGTEETRLRKLAAGADVEFLGWQSDESLRELYQGCEAFLFPAYEDFGITAVEAMACGKPVIAYRRGGAIESVRDGETGIFFDFQSPASLADAIVRCQNTSFDPDKIRAHAQTFQSARFKKEYSSFVDEYWHKHKTSARTYVMQVVECGGPGGTGYQVAAICNGLDPNQFDTSLVYSVRPGSTQRDYELSAQGATRFFYEPDMVREISLRADMRALVALYRIFKRIRPDVVHAHSSKAGFLARLAAWAAGVKQIYYSPRGYSFLQTDQSRIVRGLYRQLERFASLFGRVVAVSDSEAALARDLSARDVYVIKDAYLGGVAKSRAPKSLGLRPRAMIVASGRLVFARQPEAFIRLASALRARRGDVDCVWIGGGDEQDRFQKMIDELGLTKAVRITGWLQHEEAVKRLSEADVLVHYSRWDAISNAILEAMANGLPVVASDHPGNRGLVIPEKTGFLVSDENELLQRTLQLIDDPALSARLGEQGRLTAQSDYSRERLIAQLTDLYNRKVAL